jgi:hypothetical protein
MVQVFHEPLVPLFLVVVGCIVDFVVDVVYVAVAVVQSVGLLVLKSDLIITINA